MALRLWPVAILIWFLLGMAVFAQTGSLVRLESGAQALFARASAAEARTGSASLFSGPNRGLFTPIRRSPAQDPLPRANASPVAQLGSRRSMRAERADGGRTYGPDGPCSMHGGS